jgi:2-keto-4-pentenoate hydratase
MSVWDDPRVRRGMQRQFLLLEDRVAAGERLAGWKVAFNTPAALQRLGIEASLVGFFTDGSTAAADHPFDVGALSNPMAEPELAVRLAKDVAAPYDRAAALEAVAGITPAFEIADFDAAQMDDLEGVLAADIFHRAMLFGPAAPASPSLWSEPGQATVHRNGEMHATVAPRQVIGDPVDVVADTARYLAAFDRPLQAGQIIMTGSITPLIPVAPGDRVTLEVNGLGSVSASFTAHSGRPSSAIDASEP